MGFNRLHRELERYQCGKADSPPFRAGPPHSPRTQQETELRLCYRACREDQLAWDEKENAIQIFERYGTNDFLEIAEINSQIRNSETRLVKPDPSSSPDRYRNLPSTSNVSTDIIGPKVGQPVSTSVSAHPILRDSDLSAKPASTTALPMLVLCKAHPEEILERERTLDQQGEGDALESPPIYPLWKDLQK